jgi:hypothetical protein
VTADATTVTVEIHGEVEFTLLRLANPDGNLEITVHSTARPQSSG